MRVGTLPRFRWENGEQQTKNKTFHFTFGRQVIVNYWTNLYFCWLLSIFASESRERAYTHWFLQFRAFPSIRPKNIEKMKLDIVRKWNRSFFSQRVRLFQLWPDPSGSGSLFTKNHQFAQVIKIQWNPSFPDATVCPRQKSTFSLTDYLR